MASTVAGVACRGLAVATSSSGVAGSGAHRSSGQPTERRLRRKAALHGVSISSSAACAVSLHISSGRQQERAHARSRGVLCAVAPPQQSSAEVEQSSSNLDNPNRPSCAENARTLAEISYAGTLATLREGWPLATYTGFGLDMNGQPLLRLRDEAVKTECIRTDSRVSLYLQNDLYAGMPVERCTLLGRALPVAENERAFCSQLYANKYGEQGSDEGYSYYRLHVERALYVSESSLNLHCVWVEGDEYAAASPDPLRDCAPGIIAGQNHESNFEELTRLVRCYAEIPQPIEEARITSIDRLGIDVKVLLADDDEATETRIPFPREVSDERDCRSLMTMMAQVAWEKERPYQPPPMVRRE